MANEREEESIPDYLEEGSPFCKREMEIPRKEGRRGMERKEKAAPWGVEMDLGG